MGNYARKIIILLLACIFFIGCDNVETIGQNNKYYTEYVIYYSSGSIRGCSIYTDNEVYTCSFQGTNYLIEKGNPEEIVSTTAPIRISKVIKYDKDGHTEYTREY